MSLYAQYGDALLAPPARSLFSIGSEATRARLPDFQHVKELEQFVLRLFVYRLDAIPTMFIQMKVGACFVSFILILVFLIIARRMYEHSFWLLRVLNRDSGQVIVPNAMLSFSIIEGVYAAVFVALQWVVSYTFDEQKIKPYHIILWILLPWCPLIVGAIWAAWGTYFATPPELVRFGQVKKDQNGVQRFLSRAHVTNAMGTCIPLLVCFSVVIPAAFADSIWTRTLHRQERWLATYAGQSLFTEPMVIEAQQVWFELLKSMRLCSITFVVWAFWALALVVCYHSVCLRLVKVIKKELDRDHNTSVPMRLGVSTRQISIEEQSEMDAQGVESGIVVPGALFPKRDSVLSKASARLSVGHLYPPSSFLHLADEDKDDVSKDFGTKSGSSSCQKVSQRDDEEEEDEDKKRGSEERRMEAQNAKRKTVRIEEADSIVERDGRSLSSDESGVQDEEAQCATLVTRKRKMIPNVIMSNRQYQVASTHVQRTQSEPMRRRELKKAFHYILIQFCAIGPAAVCFFGLAVFMAVLCHGGTEQPFRGGTLFEHGLCFALVFLCWVTCLFGGITFFAIALRTYEPVFSQISLNGSGSGGQA